MIAIEDTASRRYYERNRELVSQRFRERYILLRSAVAMLKLERGCVDCGYAEHPEALDFDHVAGKRKAVSRLRTIEGVLEEIELCEVRCANCHRIRTGDRRDSY